MEKRTCRSSILVLLMGLAACTFPDQAAPTAPPATEPSGPPPINHTLIPANLPEERTNNAGDHDSSKSAGNEEAPGGDRFTYGQYERPFNANTMDVYFPYLDIQDTQTFEDQTWVYATILVKGRADDGSLPGRYALEIDNDRDGKGDWLVLVLSPSSTDWTTEGVQVWQDTNKDVGGLKPVFSEEGLVSDGFDLKVFDSAQGDDPDTAWARISPENPNMIILAVKRGLVDDDGRYLAGMWAGNEDLSPAMFDFNDHMTHEQAGAAIRGYEVYYPIKQLAELDASCRVAVGFQPSGSEPGLCLTLDPSEPGSPPPAGCPPNPNCNWGMNADCSCKPMPPVP